MVLNNNDIEIFLGPKLNHTEDIRFCHYFINKINNDEELTLNDKFIFKEVVLKNNSKLFRIIEKTLLSNMTKDGVKELFDKLNNYN